MSEPRLAADVALSKRVAELVPTRGMSAWELAYRALAQLGRRPGDLLHGACYVEGRAVMDDGTRMDHGWLELGEKIVDPSWWEEGLVYFAGPRWTLAEAERGADGQWPLVHRQGYVGTGSAEYNEAWYQAGVYAKTVRERVEPVEDGPAEGW